MKVVLTTWRTQQGTTLGPGAECEVSEAEARRLIDAGCAVPARVETEHRASPENAALPISKSRKEKNHEKTTQPPG